MYFAIMDVGCSDCGETSNLVGIFTTEDKARTALKEYIKVNHLERNPEHEFYIYKIDILDKIYQNSFEHLVEEFKHMEEMN